MNQTFQNSAQVLSVGVFFTLMVLGLSTSLPHALSTGLQAHGVSPAAAGRAAALPPISVLFAAFLGYNPIQHLLGAHALSSLSAHSQAVLMGRTFFPHLISAPFQAGLREAFVFSIIACLVAAGASLLRGGVYYHEESGTVRSPAAPQTTAAPQTSPIPVMVRNGDEPAGDRIPAPARVTST
jgi:hypothetical protein